MEIELAEPVAEPCDFSHVSERAKAIRRLFVAEFVKDFDPGASVLRLGFNYSRPTVQGQNWLKEPYTQYILDQYLRTAEDEALITRQQIIASLNREANNFGLDSSGASRVSALGKLAKILGMEIDRKQVDVRVAGGIMLVPLGASQADWEKNAKHAQLELKEEAKK